MIKCSDNEDTVVLMEKNYRFLVFSVTICKWSRLFIKYIFINGLVSANTCKIANACNFSY